MAAATEMDDREEPEARALWRAVIVQAFVDRDWIYLARRSQSLAMVCSLAGLDVDVVVEKARKLRR